MDDIFKIDKHMLDEELVRQPKLYGEYAMKLADAREVYERAKARFDVVEAEVDKDVRNNPEDYDIQKVTEEVVKKTVTLSKRVRKAKEEVIKTKHDVDVLYAIVSALDHRKSSLEQLCYLHSRDYYAAPVMPKATKRKSEEPN